MIASLGMYDRPETAGANDRLWALIRDGLRARGLAAPDALTRGDAAYWPAWQAPDLVLSQTCGFPFRAKLHRDVTLIGTPDLRLPGCPPGHYHSVIIARSDDARHTPPEFAAARFAFNEDLSQSGWAAPWQFFADRGLALTAPFATGSHRESARAVAEGRADFAAIDALTWALLTRWDAWTQGLRVIARTQPTPTLPFISAKGANRAATFAAVAEGIAALDEADRQTLHLFGIVDIAAERYLSVPIPPAPDRIGQLV